MREKVPTLTTQMYVLSALTCCIEEEIPEIAPLQPPSVNFVAVAALKAKLTNQPGHMLQYLTAR